MSYMEHNAAFAPAGEIQELSFDEIDLVDGGKVNWRMVGQGGVLIGAGALAVATGGFSLVVVGSISLAFGGIWSAQGLNMPV